ncbi:DUF6233 domain-containing protein [Streptomyces sp. Wb2n-11]|uniref:DUF6233 domain-containing protein n=1 Tax=Streptomyces sp. Wb2n-11 TaxID=1030533 RepID=UPI0021005645|nr:DUF6233 domain-containing protein [Streptomyces sp. Wb2n-11]
MTAGPEAAPHERADRRITDPDHRRSRSSLTATPWSPCSTAGRTPGSSTAKATTPCASAAPASSRSFPPGPIVECWDTGNRCVAAEPEQIRRLLAEGVPACPYCRPDTALGVLE